MASLIPLLTSSEPTKLAAEKSSPKTTANFNVPVIVDAVGAAMPGEVIVVGMVGALDVFVVIVLVEVGLL